MGQAEGNELIEAARKKTKDASDNEIVVKRYEAGSYFGELALLRSEPRSASVVARAACVAISVSRHDFMRYLGSAEVLLNRTSLAYTHTIESAALAYTAVRSGRGRWCRACKVAFAGHRCPKQHPPFMYAKLKREQIEEFDRHVANLDDTHLETLRREMGAAVTIEKHVRRRNAMKILQDGRYVVSMLQRLYRGRVARKKFGNALLYIFESGQGCTNMEDAMQRLAMMQPNARAELLSIMRRKKQVKWIQKRAEKEERQAREAVAAAKVAEEVRQRLALRREVDERAEAALGRARWCRACAAPFAVTRDVTHGFGVTFEIELTAPNDDNQATIVWPDDNRALSKVLDVEDNTRQGHVDDTKRGGLDTQGEGNYEAAAARERARRKAEAERLLDAVAALEELCGVPVLRQHYNAAVVGFRVGVHCNDAELSRVAGYYCRESTLFDASGQRLPTARTGRFRPAVNWYTAPDATDALSALIAHAQPVCGLAVPTRMWYDCPEIHGLPNYAHALHFPPSEIGVQNFWTTAKQELLDEERTPLTVRVQAKLRARIANRRHKHYLVCARLVQCASRRLVCMRRLARQRHASRRIQRCVRGRLARNVLASKVADVLARRAHERLLHATLALQARWRGVAHRNRLLKKDRRLRELRSAFADLAARLSSTADTSDFPIRLRNLRAVYFGRGAFDRVHSSDLRIFAGHSAAVGPRPLFWSHRFVLSTSSARFRRVFSDTLFSPRREDLHVPEEPHVLRLVLQFLYGNAVSLCNPDDAVAFCACAQRCGFTRAYDHAKASIERVVDATNVCVLYNAALTERCSPIARLTNAWLIKNLDAVVEHARAVTAAAAAEAAAAADVSSGWRRGFDTAATAASGTSAMQLCGVATLSHVSIASLFKSDLLVVKAEATVLEALLQWLRAEDAAAVRRTPLSSRARHRETLLQYVRWRFLSLDVLRGLVLDPPHELRGSGVLAQLLPGALHAVQTRSPVDVGEMREYLPRAKLGLERALLQEYEAHVMTHPAAAGEAWFLVCRRWWTRWHLHVLDWQHHPVPDVIDNASLLNGAAGDANSLLPGLEPRLETDGMGWAWRELRFDTHGKPTTYIAYTNCNTVGVFRCELHFVNMQGPLVFSTLAWSAAWIMNSCPRVCGACSMVGAALGCAFNARGAGGISRIHLYKNRYACGIIMRLW